MSESDVIALRQKIDRLVSPSTGRAFGDAGMVENVLIRGRTLFVALLTDGRETPEMLRGLVDSAVTGHPAIDQVQIAFTAHRQQKSPASAKPKLIPDIKFKIAVASGKGGVGKSTTAVNLAIALSSLGMKVGLLDADIYGPSVPTMTGLQEQPEAHNGKISPLKRWGLSVMSIGFLMNQDTALIWRGPMVMGALEKMIGDTDWGSLDVLIIDMPPGTGDAQLTIAQRIDLSGAVIVSTPQTVALQDARRGIRMFQKVDVPVFGVVENMSGFCCPACGHQSDIFGIGGAQAEAAALNVPFLGAIPLRRDVRDSADNGTPIVAAAPESHAAAPYIAIATALQAQLAQTGAVQGSF